MIQAIYSLTKAGAPSDLMVFVSVPACLNLLTQVCMHGHDTNTVFMPCLKLHLAGDLCGMKKNLHPTSGFFYFQEQSKWLQTYKSVKVHPARVYRSPSSTATPDRPPNQAHVSGVTQGQIQDRQSKKSQNRFEEQKKPGGGHPLFWSLNIHPSGRLEHTNGDCLELKAILNESTFDQVQNLKKIPYQKIILKKFG